METIEAKHITKEAPKKRPTFSQVMRVITALGALALLTFLVVKVYNMYQLSTEKIYNESYVPYKLSIVDITDTSTFTTIELYYAEKDYDEVVRQSRNLLSVLDRERLLIGVSYLQKEQYLRAISWLTRLADLESNPYQQPAQFYLALTHLKNKDYDRAIELMQAIMETESHIYKDRFTPQMVADLRLLKWL